MHGVVWGRADVESFPGGYSACDRVQIIPILFYIS